MKINRIDGGRTLKIAASGEVLGRKRIGEMIRSEEVDEIEVTDEHDADWTEETLFEIAFHDSVPYKYSSILSEFVPIEKMYAIIEAGGISNYVLRKKRW